MQANINNYCSSGSRNRTSNEEQDQHAAIEILEDVSGICVDVLDAMDALLGDCCVN